MNRLGIQRGRLSASMLVTAGLLLALGACRPAPASDAPEATPPLTVTPVPFVPTVTPIPSPTDLPPVVPPTVTPISSPTATPTPDPNVAAIHMQPNLGELDEQVRITAFGFVPGSTVVLHWARPGIPPAGSPAMTVQVDDTGAFDVTLTVPSLWPGGAPAEHDSIELRAIGEEDRQAWAAYAYVPLFREWVAPGSTYANATYGYAIDLPPGWTAQDADPTDVTFGPQGEAKTSFIRVVSNSNPDVVVAEVMPQLAPGLSYDVESGKLGAADGKRVVVSDNRQVYWFLGHDGRTYVLHFPMTDETLAEFTYSTFRFTG